MDNHITAVFTGIVVACLLIGMVAGHKPPVTTCYAYVKDGQGNIHVLQGVQNNE